MWTVVRTKLMGEKVNALLSCIKSSYYLSHFTSSPSNFENPENISGDPSTNAHNIAPKELSFVFWAAQATGDHLFATI